MTDNSVSPTVLLQSSLQIDEKVRTVTLTGHCILWQDVPVEQNLEASARPLFNHKIPIKEVIAVSNEQKAHSHPYSGRVTTDSCCLESAPLYVSSFTVFCIQRDSKHKWVIQKILFGCENATLCDKWVSQISYLISNPDLNRPKDLLVFVNPYGGKKRGPKIYREKVAPLFQMCGIKTEVITTQKANHAQEIMEQYDTNKIDGVVCVGGDGMFSEICNGLLTRTQRINNTAENIDFTPVRPSLRIGIIPAGSTDTVVYSTVGINDPVTSALHIIIGDELGLDVASVFHRDQLLCYNISMLGYGFLGDIIEHSERNRWMGPKRYDWFALRSYASFKTYDGEISFRLSDDRVNHPQDGSRCTVGCSVCNAAREKDTNPKLSSTSAISADWQTVQGRFIAINCHLISCRFIKCKEGASPCCHTGDGYLDLVTVESCSRLDYLRFLIRSTSKDTTRFQLPFVNVYRVKEFRFQAISDETGADKSHGASTNKIYKLPSTSPSASVWNCDGEVIDYSDLYVRVHCQLVQLFARGVEEDIPVPRKSCSRCCFK